MDKMLLALMLAKQAATPGLTPTERTALIARSRALRNKGIQDRLVAFQRYVDEDAAKRSIH